MIPVILVIHRMPQRIKLIGAKVLLRVDSFETDSNRSFLYISYPIKWATSSTNRINNNWIFLVIEIMFHYNNIIDRILGSSIFFFSISFLWWLKLLILDVILNRNGQKVQNWIISFIKINSIILFQIYTIIYSKIYTFNLL